jgi:hypothetical protein
MHTRRIWTDTDKKGIDTTAVTLYFIVQRLRRKVERLAHRCYHANQRVLI